jgi:hypothetical protein
MLTLFHLEFMLRVLEETFLLKEYEYHLWEFHLSDGTIIKVDLNGSANIVR